MYDSLQEFKEVQREKESLQRKINEELKGMMEKAVNVENILKLENEVKTMQGMVEHAKTSLEEIACACASFIHAQNINAHLKLGGICPLQACTHVQTYSSSACSCARTFLARSLK